MLNKSICHICRCERWGNFPVYLAHFWACPAIQGNVNAKDSPPAKCYKLFEHAVAESVNIDKTGGVDNA